MVLNSCFEDVVITPPCRSSSGIYKNIQDKVEFLLDKRAAILPSLIAAEQMPDRQLTQ